jgi:hypothetical protein
MPARSLTGPMTLSNRIVMRSARLYTGQAGKPVCSGLPPCAKAIQALCIASAKLDCCCTRYGASLKVAEICRSLSLATGR